MIKRVITHYSNYYATAYRFNNCDFRRRHSRQFTTVMARRVQTPAFANAVTQLGPPVCSWRLSRKSSTWSLRTSECRTLVQTPLRRARRARVIKAVERDANTESEVPAPDPEPSVSPDFIDALILEAEREERAAAAAGDASGGIKTVRTFLETPDDEPDRGPVVAAQVNVTGNGRNDDNDDNISDFFLDNVVINDDELMSDDTHVVVDGTDIAELLGRVNTNMSRTNATTDVTSTTLGSTQRLNSSSFSVNGDSVETGSDAGVDDSSTVDSNETGDSISAASAVFDPDGSFEAALQKAAEELSDERYAQRTSDSTSARVVPLDERERESGVEGEGSTGMMEYFTEENVMYMPSWIREMYESNTHHELQQGADRLEPSGSAKRLQDIAERRRASGGHEGNVKHDDGIVDCTVSDVAYDYHVPVEFIVDALLAIGVPIPITESTSVRDSMTSNEISRLLRLVSTHDPAVLSDRYSDNCIEEVAEAYNLHTEDIISICKKEGLYLCNGAKTHLSTVREDRVLDILLKGEVLGKEYPPLLDGLE